MLVPPEVAELEALAKVIRLAGGALLNADMFDRWGPKDDDEQREAIEREAREAEQQRRAAIDELERRVIELRATAPELLDRWANAHLELLDDYLGQADADSTGAFVAGQEREHWTGLSAGERSRVEQNVYYVRYDSALYERLFGFSYS